MTSEFTPAASDSPAAVREADAFGGTILTSAPALATEQKLQFVSTNDDRSGLTMAGNEDYNGVTGSILGPNGEEMRQAAASKSSRHDPGNLTETEASLLHSWGIEYDESKVNTNPKVGMPLEDSGIHVVEGDFDGSSRTRV